MVHSYIGLAICLVALVLGGPQTSQNPLVGEWTAIELAGTAVPPNIAPHDRQPYLEFTADGRVAGADGCNRVTGPYASKDNGLTFGQIAGTMMACLKTDEVSKRFRAALKGTSHWSIVNDRLELYGATGKPLAVFVRREPKKE
jgi:copper homeostasis protein (lipoprotein)